MACPPAPRRTKPVCLTVCGRPPAVRAQRAYAPVRTIRTSRSSKGRTESQSGAGPGLGLQSRQEAQRICLVRVESQCRIPDQIQRDIHFLPPAYGLPLSLESTCPAYPASGSGRRLSDRRNPSRATTRSKANQLGVGPRHCLRPCPILLLLCMTILFLL